MSLLSPAPVAILLAGALWLSRSSAAERERRWVALLVALAAIAVTVLLVRSGRTGSSGLFDSDPLSTFSSLILLAAVAISCGTSASGSSLLTGAALAIVAVSTRDLLVVAVAVQLYFLVFREAGRRDLLVPTFLGVASFASVGAIAWSVGATDLAAIASTEAGGVLRLGLAAFIVSVALAWLAQSRRALRFGGSDLVVGVALSFVLLVAVVTVFLRLQAWVPDAAVSETFRALALLGLGLGALGMLSATRISTFATALLLERAGAAAFALLGGVHSRVPLLVELVATGISLLLVGLALAGEDGKIPFSLDDLSKRRSIPAGILLLAGVFSAAALPPFPGFFARFAASSAVLLTGSSNTVAAMVAFAFFAGVGSMRMVARAWESSSETPDSSRPATSRIVVGLGLVAVAVWFLLVAPSSILDWATKAASGIF